MTLGPRVGRGNLVGNIIELLDLLLSLHFFLLTHEVSPPPHSTLTNGILHNHCAIIIIL